MRNLTYGILHIQLFLRIHAFRDQETECTLSEILQQDFLALYSFQVLGQVIQQVILGFRGCHSENGRYQQSEAQDDDQHPVPYKPFHELLHS